MQKRSRVMKAILAKATLSKLLALGLTVLAPLACHAIPYATDLTNNAGTVSFRLNEAANQVKVIGNGGAVTNDLGPMPAGLTITNLSATIPAGVIKVEVHSVGNDTIRTNSAPVPFNFARGVAVNRNPSSPNFGRVYVANPTAGTKGDGIFIFGSDLSDTFGQGATARTGGLDFATGGAASPYRLTVGEDDGRLYIADWSDSAGNLYVTDADVTSGGYALQALVGTAAMPTTPVGSANNHGSVAAAVVIGVEGVNLTIYTVDEDLTTDRDAPLSEMNSLWQYPVGTAALPTSLFDPTNKLATPEIAFVAQTMDLARGPNGYLYMSQYRSAGSQPAVYVVDPNANPEISPYVLTNTLQISVALGATTDELRATGGVAVSPDGKWMAVINIENNTVMIVRLIDGIPDLTRRVAFTGLGTAAGRGIAFDAANNLYAISDGAQLKLQAITLGISAVAVTGSDGTFEMTTPPQVYVRATEPTASETGPVDGVFTFTREGDTANPLTVSFTLTGTATNGVDYVTVPTTITFAAGDSSTNLVITPIDDSLSEANETVIVTLASNPNYVMVDNKSATVTIVDNDPPLITISATSTNMYERVPADFVRFRLTRGGDIANTSVGVSLLYAGTATRDVDYSGASDQVFFNPGEAFVDLTLNPIDDFEIEGRETITISIVPQPEYVVGSPSAATAYIVDDDIGEEIVLFADDFDTDTSANWIVRAGAVNNVEDYHAVFNYDYAATKFIPPAPGSSSTLGLIVTANKKDETLAAAGVNLYPAGQTFSGDYALKFNMYIEGLNGAGTTEHVIFGINHSGTRTNYASRATSGTGFAANTPGGGDGIWFNVVADSSNFPGGNDFGAFTSVNSPPTILASATAPSQTQIFKAPPYRFAGTPASFLPQARQVWLDVEVRHAGGMVTLLINNSQILQFANNTGFNSGTIMLGYNDAFGSVGGGAANTGPDISNVVLGGYVVYDNVRVVRAGLPQISQTRIVGGNVEIDFNDSSHGPFTLRAASVVTGPYNVIGATIITNNPGSYRAVTPYNPANPIQFYRVQRN